MNFDLYQVLTILYILCVDCNSVEKSMRLTHGSEFDAELTGEDLKQIEICHNHKSVSLYGNFTRHHKKERRRRRTTTPIYDVTDTLYPSHSHTYRTYVRQSEIELLHSINKRSYKESSPAKGNRILNLKSKEHGVFLTENCTSVLAQIGTTAILHCEVSDITENTVTWIRRKDYSLLSVGLVTYSADNRFFTAHGKHVKDWSLHIRFASASDSGYYECQVPTHPPTSIYFKLILVEAYAVISGESEKIIHEGSMLKLLCVVRNSTEPPSYVFWYFEHRMINYDLNGVSVSNLGHSSELMITQVESKHAGNYTCVPANSKPASATVHIVQSETPAAMQHENTNTSTKTSYIFNGFHITALLIILHINTMV